MQKKYFVVMKLSEDGPEYSGLFPTLYRTDKDARAAIDEERRKAGKASDYFEYYVETVRLSE